MKTFSKIIKIIFLSLCILACVAFAGLFWFANSLGNNPDLFSAQIYQPFPTPGNDPHSIEADAQIKIPASAREIYAMISGFRELDAWVRLDLPVADLTSFIDSAHCKTPLAATDPKKHTPDDSLDLDWWRPHLATYLEECTGGHDYLYQRILVDRTDPQMVRVYVFSMTSNFTTPTPTIKR